MLHFLLLILAPFHLATIPVPSLSIAWRYTWFGRLMFVWWGKFTIPGIMGGGGGGWGEFIIPCMMGGVYYSRYYGGSLLFQVWWGEFTIPGIMGEVYYSRYDGGSLLFQVWWGEFIIPGMMGGVYYSRYGMQVILHALQTTLSDAVWHDPSNWCDMMWHAMGFS